MISPRFSSPSPMRWWSGLTRIALCGSFALCASEAVTAQFSTQVRFSNLTAHPRSEWATATVPLPPGVLVPGGSLVSSNGGTFQPFGATWPGGSHRYVRLTTRVNMLPGTDQMVTVTAGAPPNEPAFVVSPWVASRFSTFNFGVFAITSYGGLTSIAINSPGVTGSILEATTSHITLKHQGRIPATDLFFHSWLTFFSDQDNARFELRITNSDTGSPQTAPGENPDIWYQDVHAVGVFADNAAIDVRGDTRLGVVYSPQAWSGTNFATLIGAGRIYDGQGQEWFGTLLFCDPAIPLSDGQLRLDTMAAGTEELAFGVATNWDSSLAFGPFGKLPSAPPWVSATGVTESAASRTTFRNWLNSTGTAWEDRPLGLLKIPGTTGAQDDFGNCALPDVFRHALTHRVEEARFCAGEEAMRIHHYLETDGNRVLASGHPNWRTWDCITHYSPSVSPDRLNKPTTGVIPWGPTTSNNWYSKDEEHWSSNLLAIAYLLTSSYSLREELDFEAEAYVAKVSWPSAARGAGRMLLSMSWNHLCTGNPLVVTEMASDISAYASQFVGLQPGIGPVQPFRTNPGPNCLAGMYHDAWRPWEESLAVAGFEACALVTTGTTATTANLMALTASRSVTMYGWDPTAAQPNVQIAKDMRWLPGGAPLLNPVVSPPFNCTNPLNEVIYYSPFNVWSMPSLILSQRYAIQTGDPALAAGAAFLLGGVQMQRGMPPGGGWDLFSNWEAVQ